MIDKQAILAILKKYFEITGRVTVDDQGLVMVTDDCKLRDSKTVTQLPVQFASVGGNFACSGNKLTSLDGIPKSINGKFNLDYNPNLPMLRLFKVRDITKVLVRDTVTNKWGHPVEHIINRYIHLGINGILPCAAELYKAGYGGNAKL